MVDGMLIEEKIIGDDAAVASPPDRFRTHQREALVAAKSHQFFESGGKFTTQCVVGIVVKTLHTPQRVDAFVDARLLRSPPTQGGPVAITDLHASQVFRQPVDIIGGIGSRSGKCPDVDQHANSSDAQHVEEFVERPARMTDGDELRVHQSILVNAAPLWAAM